MDESLFYEFFEYQYGTFDFISDILKVIFIIVGFIFKGFAIRYIAKKKGLNDLWMAFVPFLNYYLLGKVLGKAIIWGNPINNVGLWLAIVSCAQFVLSTLLNVGYYNQIIEYLGYTVEYTSKFVENWANGIGWLYDITLIVSLIIDLGYIFFYVSFIFLTFRKLNPRRSILFSVLSIFVEPLFGIFLFVSRKNEPFSYEDYLKMHARSYYGGSYYNGAYYGPNNNANQPNGEEKPKVEDPFPEFESDNKNDSDNFFN